MFLIFDLETTGLPKRFDAPITQLSNWPRVVQLSWILLKDGNIAEEKDFLVKPSGFSIPSKASSIHGITTARANAQGHRLENILAEFSAHFSGLDPALPSVRLVAHNLNFDRTVLAAEMLRSKCEHYQKFLNLKAFCTMLASADFCKIPHQKFKGQNKWPSLQELHKKLFAEEFSGAHNSLNDVRACARCFMKLQELGLIGLN